MPIRLSGLTSGLDTEAIVGALVSAYSYKKDKYTKAQTKLTWKQDAWKSLNSKVYNLYTEIGNMRYSSSYSAKKTTVSDTSKATAVASGTAINGTQTLSVNQLASTAYITGGYLENAKTGDATLGSLGIVSSNEKAKFNVTTAEGSKEIEVDSTTKLDTLVSKLNEAGLSANFDSKNQRLFISAQKSGSAGNFTLKAANNSGLNTLLKLGLMSSDDIDGLKQEETGDSKYAYRSVNFTYNIGSTEYNKSVTNNAEGFKTLLTNLRDAKQLTSKTLEERLQEIEDGDGTDEEKEAAKTKMQNKYETAESLLETHDKFLVYLDEKYGTAATTTTNEETGEVVTTPAQPVDWINMDDDAVAELASNVFASGTYDSSASAATEDEISRAINAVRDAYVNLSEAIAGEDTSKIAAAKTALNEVLSDSTNKKWADYVEQNFGGSPNTNYEEGEEYKKYLQFWTQSDNKKLVDDTFYQVDLAAGIAINNEEIDAIDTSRRAVKVEGLDAEIQLNGVTYTSDTNSVTVNGLTIEALGITEDPIFVSVQNDTDALYDKIKDFLTSYNNLINEMQKLYNADSAKDYEPLTDDEKAEMSETEIEKWEQKIKDALLRRDSTLSGLISTLTTSMLKSYDVNGSKWALSTLGIGTLGSLKAEKNENYAYHIDGDSEDSYTSGKADKLRAAIAEDADAVIDFMKQLTSDLYTNLDKKMKSTAVKSVYTVYNDKEMASEYSNYSSLIKQWTDRIKDQEDAYYKKFSQMESALAKLQSNSSSLTSMLGG